MWTATILIGAFVALGYVIYRDRKKKHQLFRKLGIPGPEPHWWYGNLYQLRTKAESPHEILHEWSQKYGPTFGYYEGPSPILVSSDLEFLKDVFIKNFHKFHGRKLATLQADPVWDPCPMIQSQGQRWKRLRTITNPSFTAAKLKYVSIY
eukprot:GHVO01042175.1.p1 GENE.GHVO01042175.1~~GHVO01042175.1.p1  ORF type:complete len:150 (+),score=7.43 GHVO01042175.1:122-571(+)